MQAPKGVQIGEINDSLARPLGYLYNLHAMLPLLQPLPHLLRHSSQHLHTFRFPPTRPMLKTITTVTGAPWASIQASPPPYMHPHRKWRCGGARKKKDSSPMSITTAEVWVGWVGQLRVTTHTISFRDNVFGEECNATSNDYEKALVL